MSVDIDIIGALRSCKKGRLPYSKCIDMVKLRNDLSKVSPPPLSRYHTEKESAKRNTSFGITCEDLKPESKTPGNKSLQCDHLQEDNTEKSPKPSSRELLHHHGWESRSERDSNVCQKERNELDQPRSPNTLANPMVSPPVSPDHWKSIQDIMNEEEIYRSRVQMSLLERRRQFSDHDRALDYLMQGKQRDANARLEHLEFKRQSSIERRHQAKKEEANKTIQSLRKNQEKQKEKMDSKQKEIEQRRLDLEKEEKRKQEELESKLEALRTLLAQVKDCRSKFTQTVGSFQHKSQLPEMIDKFQAALDKVCAGLLVKIQKAEQSANVPPDLIKEFEGHAEKSQFAVQFLKKHIEETEGRIKADLEKKREEEVKREEEKKKTENLKNEVAQNFGVQALSFALTEKESRVELLAKVEASIKTFVTSTDSQMKQYRFDLQRAVNTPINAISGVASRHLRDKLHRLLALLRGQEVEVSNRRVKADRTPEALLFCQNLIAKMLVKKGEEQVSSFHESAFPIAAVLLGLWSEFPTVGALFLAHLQSRCPYVLPHYHVRVKGESNSDYHRSLGYKVEDDGTIEEQDKFLRRMSGLMRLYCACLVTDPPPTGHGQTLAHPHGLEHAWGWLARCLNQDPHPDVTATLMHDVLASSGHWLLRRYSIQFAKLVYALYKQYLPQLKEVTITSAAVGRLQSFLETFLASGRLPQPEGTLPHGFWGS